MNRCHYWFIYFPIILSLTFFLLYFLSLISLSTLFSTILLYFLFVSYMCRYFLHVTTSFVYVISLLQMSLLLFVTFSHYSLLPLSLSTFFPYFLSTLSFSIFLLDSLNTFSAHFFSPLLNLHVWPLSLLSLSTSIFTSY